MKGNKLSFSICVIPLVAAGMAEIQPGKGNHSVYYWQETGSVKICQAVEVDFHCPPSVTGGCIGISGPSVGKQLYLDSICRIPLGVAE